MQKSFLLKDVCCSKIEEIVMEEVIVRIYNPVVNSSKYGK